MNLKELEHDLLKFDFGYGAVFRGIAARSNLAEETFCVFPRMFNGDLAITTKRDPALRALSAANLIFDDECFAPGRSDFQAIAF